MSYGLYIVCSGNSESGNGYISNTVFQVTAEPPQFAASCNKDNFTAEFIKKTGYYSVSVLSEKVSRKYFANSDTNPGVTLRNLKEPI